MSSLYDKNATCYSKESAPANEVDHYLIKSLAFPPFLTYFPTVSLFGVLLSQINPSISSHYQCVLFEWLCHQSFFKTPKSCPILHQIPATKYETQGFPQSHLSISCMPGFISSYTSFYSFCSWMSIFHCDIVLFVFALNFLFLKFTCENIHNHPRDNNDALFRSLKVWVWTCTHSYI